MDMLVFMLLFFCALFFAAVTLIGFTAKKLVTKTGRGIKRTYAAARR